MVLSNFEINLLAQSTLGIASIIGLVYKTCHYKKIWEDKYKLTSHELKSSLILSSCKLVWGMLVCHLFNIFSADIHCNLLLDNSLTYYPMYTLITGFELGFIFIEPHIVSLFKKIGTRYNIIGLKYPDVYPNLMEVIDIKYFKIGFGINIIIFLISLCLYFLYWSNESLAPLFIILSIIGSIFITLFICYPFLLESNVLGQRKITADTKTYVVSRKDFFINMSSWIFIKIFMKSIWVAYILNSNLKDNLCSLAQNGVFFNKITNAMFYMVGCSLIINIISVCYQYIFMNGDKLKYISRCSTTNIVLLKKISNHIGQMICISFFSSIIWLFYIIEKLNNKQIQVNYRVITIATTIFPWSIYIAILIIKSITLYLIKYNHHYMISTFDMYNEL
jgi:hypothetical protein